MQQLNGYSRGSTSSSSLGVHDLASNDSGLQH